MKQFFGAFFGSIVGIIIATVIAVFIIVAVIKSSVSDAFKQEKETTELSQNSVLKLTLDGPVHDREKLNPFKEFGSGSPFGDEDELGINTLLKKIKYAAEDKNIKGMYLYFKDLHAGFGALNEMRNALADFKKQGKFIYAYSENYSQQEYYLASVSDKVFLNPQGSIDWKGLNMSMLFFKNTLEKLDIDMQVFRHGKFKSAVEPFLMDKMSQANRYQSEIFLNSIWNSMLTDISGSRKISIDNLNKMANGLEIQFPEDAVGKFVDATLYEDEVVLELKKKIGIKEKDKLKLVDFAKYEEKGKLNPKLNSSKIAVIYATGTITDGEGDDEQVGSAGLAKAIRDARLDEKIKAIVLRVNSPGGSALASEVIWREVMLAKKVKPFIVSMGDLAASGGYYISCGADRIFAQPNTITGSIGVFGILPNLKKMLENKFGINIDTVSTNKYSDIGNGLRPVNQREYDFIQNSVEKVYDVFTKHVAEGRNMSQAEVDSIGQGRVWTGTDAQKIKLVDELGGLNDAIAYAANKVGMKEFKVVELPKQKGPFDSFLGKKESDMEETIIKRNLGFTYTYFKKVQQLFNMKGVQARLPFEMVIE